MKWVICVSLALGLLLSGSVVSHATDVIPATLEYMTEFADTIVIGQVKASNSYWEDQKIYTDVTIDVAEFIKNANQEAGPELTVKYLGGTVGDTSLEVSLAPSFEVGDKKLLFLKQFEGKYFPFGIVYGVYQIIYDETRQTETVEGPYFNYSEHYNLATMEPFPTPETLRTAEGKDLDVFVGQVKQFIK